MVADAIDWNICPEFLGMTESSIARGHRPSAIEPEKCQDTIGIEGQGDVCSININN
jgi:hypothetical protein